MKRNAMALAGLTMVAFLMASCTTTNDRADEPAGEAAKVAATHGQSGVVDSKSKKNILQVALSSPDHTTLVAAVQAAGLQDVLVNAGPLTVFAPNNAAFDKLPAGTVETLLKPENKNKLAAIVTSHAAPGTFAGDLLKNGDQIYLATGQYVDIEVKDGATYVNGAKILGTIDATNGVVHVIDTVFLFD